jgi:predicted dehydrogenase
MDHGKDYFTDKAPFTTLDQLAAARSKVQETGRKYMVYFSERLHVESAVYAGQLIEQGAIGRVVQTLGTGPHRINAPSRPVWFFELAKYGGILCDIGSHQIEQFLYFTGARDAKVLHSKVGNYKFPQYPELEDFGDATLVADNGATGYFRVDWLTPDGLSTWGDGRMFILGTDGYIELRKYVDIARDKQKDHVYLVNHEGEHLIEAAGKVGVPFFGKLILDCIQRTEHAMTQEHAFKAAELCLIAQRDAIRVHG